MKILIHALGANMGGAMRHLTSFLPELGVRDPNREYVVLVRESFPVLKVAENIRLIRVSDRASSGWMKRIVGDVFELPQKLKREKFSAIVSLTNFEPIELLLIAVNQRRIIFSANCQHQFKTW